MITATAWSDDHNIEVEFDATPYFQQASILDILELAGCDWSRDYPADAVAMYVADPPASDGHEGHSGLQRLFQYLEAIANDPMKKDCHGFECQVDRQDAMDWVGINRPELVQAIKQVEEREGSPHEILEKLPQKRFSVRLARTETRRLVIEVEAADAEHAGKKALEGAGDLNFTEGTIGEGDICVEEVNELADDRSRHKPSNKRRRNP